MKKSEFVLHPFPGTAPLPGLVLSGQVTRRSNRLTLGYNVSGPLEEILISEKSANPARRIGLWHQTCFEFFLAEQGSPVYWEFNLAPGGDWNVFRFEGYRQGLKEEETLSSVIFDWRTEAGEWLLSLEMDLRPLFRFEALLEMAVCAVLKTRQGEDGLWALAHFGPTADFHRRDGFMIKL